MTQPKAALEVRSGTDQWSLADLWPSWSLAAFSSTAAATSVRASPSKAR